MKAKSTWIGICGLAFIVSLVAGCSDPNSDVKPNLADLPLPKGVSDQPKETPFKSRAKSSSPPLNQQSPK